jgi:NAD(P)H-dependent FMN reductase
MAHLLAFAGSNSSTSINFKLIKYTASLVTSHQVRILDMVDYPFPMFSEDLEREKGYSNVLVELKNDIKKVDGLLISVNEHNANPSAYFKNLIDWLSRVDRRFLDGKKIFLMATSGGKRGAQGSLEVVKNVLPRFGAQIVSVFSLPLFYEKFDEKQGITDPELSLVHRKALDEFLKAL